MNWSRLLSVDRLEDRCVPTVGLDAAIVPAVPDPSTVVQIAVPNQPSAVVVLPVTAPVAAIVPDVVVAPTASQPSDPSPGTTAPPIFVIDGYLIDPNATAPPPKVVADPVVPIPDVYWQASQAPQSVVPPISNPFWY